VSDCEIRAWSFLNLDKATACSSARATSKSKAVALTLAMIVPGVYRSNLNPKTIAIACAYRDWIAAPDMLRYLS